MFSNESETKQEEEKIVGLRRASGPVSAHPPDQRQEAWSPSATRYFLKSRACSARPMFVDT